MRKIVYWRRQKFQEAFEYSRTHGWRAADYRDWPRGSYKFVEIVASDDDFNSRRNGCIVL